MSIVQTYVEKAILSELSYTDLYYIAEDGSIQELTATQYVARLQGIKDKDDVTGGKYSGDGIQTFTLEQAKAFAGVTEQIKDGQVVKDDKGNIQYKFEEGKGYSIKATYTDPATGYSGVLLKNNVTGELTLSHRGTEPGSINDLLTDASLIKKTVPEQFNSLSTFMEQLIQAGTITQEDKLTMTGHSLGGTLAQMATAAYAEYVDQAVTYNAPGAKDLKTYASMENGKYYHQEYAGTNALGEPVYLNKQEITKEVYEAHQRFAFSKDTQDVYEKILPQYKKVS